MSYSLQVRAASKALALTALASAFDNAVSAQIQEKDKIAGLAAATGAVNSLADDGSRDVVVNINGSLSWNGVLADGDAPAFTGCAVNVNAYLAARA